MIFGRFKRNQPEELRRKSSVGSAGKQKTRKNVQAIKKTWRETPCTFNELRQQPFSRSKHDLVSAERVSPAAGNQHHSGLLPMW